VKENKIMNELSRREGKNDEVEGGDRTDWI
jgi:hypothetical protein